MMLKAGDAADANNYRPKGLQSIAGSVFGSVALPKMQCSWFCGGLRRLVRIGMVKYASQHSTGKSFRQHQH